MIRGRRALDELDQQIGEHIERETQDNIDQGMEPDAARREAYRKFGNVGLVREDARAVWISVWLDQFWQDVRYGFRSLRRSPGFTVVAVLTVALGIGTSTTVFSVVNAVLLRPLPYRDSDGLVWLWCVQSRTSLKQRASYPDFLDWKAESRTVDLVGYNGIETILTGTGEPERLTAELTIGNLFTLLGVAPALGTTADAEGRGRQEPLVILSDRLWRRSFNAAPDVVGRQIYLDGLSHTVTAVMPPGFQFPIRPTNPVDLWVPVERFNPALKDQRTARLIDVVGRVHRNVTIDQAQAEMNVIASNVSARYLSSNGGLGVRLIPALEEVTGDVSRWLMLLLAAVSGLLLIACLNVAALLLARATARRQEIATRSALGAGPMRIGRQLLIESVLLAGMGGCTGFVFAMWGVQSLGAVIPQSIPRATDIPIDGRVLAFAVLTSFITGGLFGLAPAWHAWNVDLTGSLQDNARTGSRSVASGRPCDVLTVGEIAVAMMLLVGAGLFIHSFSKLNQADPGFDSHSVLTFGVSWPYQTHPNPIEAFQELRRRLLDIPGVVAASIGMQLPDRGQGTLDDTSPFVDVEGRPMAPEERRHTAVLGIQPGYFRVMGIPLVKEGILPISISPGVPA